MTEGTDRAGIRVLIEESVEVNRSPEEVAERCSNDTGWLSLLANTAEEEESRSLLRVGPFGASGPFARDVLVQIAGVRTRRDGLGLWLRWQAVKHASLFPVLDAELALVRLDADRCRLTLSGSYVPPLGIFGRALDRSVMYRFAESTVHAFLRSLAEKLDEEVK